MKRFLTTLTLMLIAGTAFATPPQTGVYLSNDFGGVMLTGRFSESWVNPSASHGQVGNTIDAMSWNGAVLGTEWKVWCPSIALPPTLVSDNRDGNGTGDVTYQTTYGGGVYWMSKNGPWGDGSVDYTGTVQSFMIVTTYQYVFGQLLGIRSNVTMIGKFDGYDNCMEYTINNAAFVGTTDVMPLPSDYPPFYDSSCATGTVSRGGWGTVTQIAIRIYGSCAVATRPASWGAIKALYK